MAAINSRIEAPGYRVFAATQFRAGILVLLKTIPQFRAVLGIKDLRRAPASPRALNDLIRHRFVNKKMPAEIQQLTMSRDVVKVYSTVDHVAELKPGRTTALFLFRDGLRVAIKYGNVSSRGDAEFMFHKPDSPVVVQSEGHFL